MKYFLFVFLGFAILASSCSDKSGSNLPPSSGRTGDIYLVMDSTQWKGPLGDVLDSVFSQDMEGLPRKEPIFNMSWIDPRKLNFVLKQRRNLIFAVTLDARSAGAGIIKRTFTPESLEKIKTDPNLFSQTSQNVFAKNQEVLFLFSKTEKELIQHIRKHGNTLVEYFNQREHVRMTTSLFKSGQLKGLPQILRKDFECELKVPFGYQLVQQEPDFLWVRQINPKDDKDVFIARKRYTSPAQFQKDSLIAFRDKICQSYLFEDPERPDTHLVTETEVPFIPVITRETTINKKFAVEVKGLWRTNNLTMGGPFTAIALVDEPKGLLYYIEGFTFAPGKDQREIIRELETIIYTFKTSDQLSPAKP